MFSVLLWAIADWIEPYYCGQSEFKRVSKWRLLIVPLLVPLIMLVFVELALVMGWNMIKCFKEVKGS